jgi:hypothetical protein
MPFGRKGIEVMLDKYAFTPGETIKGKVGLKLKKPIQARKLTVALVGIRIIRQSGMPMAHGHHGAQQDQVYNIYHFEIPLDGENVYLSELYTFEIKIPADIMKSTQQPTASAYPTTGLGGKLAELAKAAEAIALVNSRIEWSVEAKLDVPMNVDIRGLQKIVIS